LGHSDFAMYNNDGTQVKNPVFPFNVRYAPKGNIVFPDEFTEDVLEQLKTIAPGTELYDVYARDSPGSEEKVIATIVSETQLVTSRWGDTKMFFRHHRIDDDIRYRPEWMEHYPYFPN